MNKKTIQQHTERGVALLIFVVFSVVISLSLVLTIGRGAYEDLATYKVLKQGKQSFYAAESGIEDAVYRMRSGENYSNFENFYVGDAEVTVNRVATIDSFVLTSEGDSSGAIRTSRSIIRLGEGVSFSFGLQSGNGGITLSNSSSIRGNVYSNGTVVGQGSAIIYGDVVAAGAGGLVDSVHATGSVWSHTITNSVIGKNAHYYSAGTISSTVVGGISYPGSADQPTMELPIVDAQVEDFKDGIRSTGSVIPAADPRCAGGTYVIDTATTLSNVRIQCNVEMRKRGASTVITLGGNVWIEGNLTFTAGPTIVASSSLGNKSVVVVVDNESNRTTSSRISVNQSTDFISGTSSSYVLLLSMNNSSEMGGTQKAIDVSQSANGKVLVYAGHGYVDLGNSISLKEVTGHKIEISNGAQVTYETGLMSLLFNSGPTGGFTIGSWNEIE